MDVKKLTLREALQAFDEQRHKAGAKKYAPTKAGYTRTAKTFEKYFGGLMNKPGGAMILFTPNDTGEFPGLHPTLSGAATPDATDLELTFLRHADDPKLKELYDQIKEVYINLPNSKIVFNWINKIIIFLDKLYNLEKLNNFCILIKN